jgi:hypothetical protein
MTEFFNSSAALADNASENVARGVVWSPPRTERVGRCSSRGHEGAVFG